MATPSTGTRGPGPLPSVILLPPPPRPASRSALNATYRPPLEAALSRLRQDGEGATLIVALAAPFLTGPLRWRKTLSWPETQTLLAGLYSILSALCAQLALPAEVHAGPGSVDARVVLVDYEPAHQYRDFRPALEANNTVIVDLATFASAYHPWQRIFHVNTEAGYALRTTYLRMLEQVQAVRQDQLVAVQGGLAMSVKPSEPSHFGPQTDLVSTVCLGGTFDHLHPGHKLLLHAAVLLLDVPEASAKTPCRFIIGITGDELLKRKQYAAFVQSWDLRAANVIEFLSSLLHLSRTGWPREADWKVEKKEGEILAHFRDGTIEIQCVVIQDAFGPTITTEAMDALVVSGETRAGGQAVNDKRKERGWHPLEIFEVDVLDAQEIGDDDKADPARAQDFATKLSSTAIRKQKAEAAEAQGQ